MHLRRSIQEQIRPFTSWDDRWRAADGGLIWCWERGRQKREEYPEVAAAAQRGELPVSASRSDYYTLEPIPGWRGGVEKALLGKRRPDGTREPVVKSGTLNYLAEWQGLRGQDLDIDTEAEVLMTCTRTGQAVLFSPVLTDAPAPEQQALLLP
jgi:hypothetical protein